MTRLVVEKWLHLNHLMIGSGVKFFRKNIADCFFSFFFVRLKTLENEQEPRRVKAVEVEKETSALTKRYVPPGVGVIFVLACTGISHKAE